MRHRDKCATPECRGPRGHGNTGLFCEPCSVVLARVREAWEAEEGQRRNKAASSVNGLRTEEWYAENEALERLDGRAA